MLSLYTVFRAGSMFLSIIEWAIVIYCVLSWFRPNFRAFYMLRSFIQPFVSPFQRLSLRLMRRFRAPVDLTMLIALLAYQLLDRIWWRLYLLLLRVM